MMAEDNSNELAGLVTSVKNDSMAEDNTDEIVSPVTSMKNDSMDEDNIDELVSPVTSVKNDSTESKPDKMSTIKLRSMSNGNKFLSYSSSTSSYNAGNTRRQSTGNLNAPDSGQDVIPHYIRSFTGSFHDFCNYGRKHSSEAKPWHPLSKKKNKLPADERSLAWTLVGEAKKGTLVKQKLSTPPGSVLGEEKKESVLKYEKEVTMVEQKPYSPPGCMEGGIDEMTMVEQKSSASVVSMLGEGENVTVVEQKLSTPPGSMMVERKKEAMVNQNLSAPPGSMLGQGKKLNMVDRRPSPMVHSLEPSEIKKKKILLTPKSVHSLKLDSSSHKIPETEKKMKSSSKI
ncbi:hypothetical protein CQW23_31901 [Capsicum baccatum]|uniref:Calmodulin-binding domain-containing protein n=1 Tax=Capsicum baccatum TaxID=33114 RepID=A0A2G2V6E2_CAPBA|nr:hypothetical protein CQW23_31901 [Capsicum baccatum]